MKAVYASGTTVSEEASKAELERILRRYGATGYGYMWDQDTKSVIVAFRVAGRKYKLEVPMPAPSDPSITQDSRGYELTKERATKRYEAEARRRWRVVVLGLKGKLELASIGEGDFTFEREFLGWAMLSDGRTVGEALDEDAGLFLAGRAPLMLTAGE